MVNMFVVVTVDKFHALPRVCLRVLTFLILSKYLVRNVNVLCFIVRMV